MRGLRLAARSLRQSPGFTFTALLVLAIGIGLNTAIFSVVDTVIFRPLPFPHPERIVIVNEHLQSFGDVGTAYPNFLDWSRESKSVVAAANVNNYELTISDGRRAERVSAILASAGFFDAIGVRPALGRAFRSDEDVKNAPGRIVLTDAIWKRQFARDPNIIGRVLRVQGEPATVVGVMPANFRFPFVKCEVIVPIGPLVSENSRSNHQGLAVARIKPGVTVSQADAELAAIGKSLSARYPESNTGWSLSAAPLQKFFTQDSRPLMITLLAAVGLVLVLACVNLAGLLLVRAAGRRREIAVRIAMGAGPAVVLRDSLWEALVLSFAGGALGVLVAAWSMSPLLSLVPDSANLPAVSLDFRVLLFAAVISSLAALLFTLAPALKSVRTDPNEALKESGRANTVALQGSRLRSALVVAEIGLALVLSLAAGLVVKSFGRLMNVDPGFDPNRAITMSLAVNQNASHDNAAQIAFWRRFLQSASQNPAIGGVGLVSFLPMTENDTESGYRLEGQPEPKNISQIPFADNFSIGGDYFGAMAIPVLKGRAFNASDDERAPKVLVIDEDFARKNYGRQNPLCKRVVYDKSLWQIVGVVRHVKDFGLNGVSREQFYFDYRQNPRPFMTVTVRPAADVRAAIRAVRETVRAIDPEIAVAQVRHMSDWLNDSTWRVRLGMVLLALFAAVALILAGIGVYGVMAYAVAQRTQEIGIRLALGATPGGVLRLVLRQASWLSLLGIGLGVLATLPFGRLLSGLLFQVSPSDAGVLAAATGVLLLMGLAAAALPAWRAASTDPLEAIRYE